MHTDGWRLVALADGSSSSSDPEDQVLTELLHTSICKSRLNGLSLVGSRELKELHACLTKPHGICWGCRNRPVDAKDGNLERVARRDRVAQD